ncbi:hypothetical protein L1765_05840 [Microaerobacter geothermalis]|uniref:hypothetical protein n=1 Tax=Microaerobacter geothermalis TaxID=674972 RepID=UPI001F2AD8A4|nr:hypothetical protein [Microaerobacter geothermalis]MCF6093507.1 hypothetical protein [Microaerobacter geothermalis]
MGPDPKVEGRNQFFVDVDRMINEGLGGGQVTEDNGLIDSALDFEEESPPTLNGQPMD